MSTEKACRLHTDLSDLWQSALAGRMELGSRSSSIPSYLVLCSPLTSLGFYFLVRVGRLLLWEYYHVEIKWDQWPRSTEHIYSLHNWSSWTRTPTHEERHAPEWREHSATPSLREGMPAPRLEQREESRVMCWYHLNILSLFCSGIAECALFCHFTSPIAYCVAWV